MRFFEKFVIAMIFTTFVAGTADSASVCSATKYRKAGNVSVEFKDSGKQIGVNGIRMALADDPGWQRSAADWLRQAWPHGVHPSLTTDWSSELAGEPRSFAGDSGYVEVYYGELTQDIDPGNGLKKGAVRLWIIFRDWDANEKSYTVFSGLGVCPNLKVAVQLFGR